MKKLGLAVLLLAGLLFVTACGESKADPASIVRGGTVYDNWWKAAEGAAEPGGNQPLWSLQSTNTRSGTDTWRCKECHGWDYKGADGAYASGSHATGFPGIYNAGTSKKKNALLDIMKGGNNSAHNFSPALSEAALTDVVNFISEGIIDETKYIDYKTKKAVGADVSNGQRLYTSTCLACHGADGKMIEFHDGEWVGTLANDNPWEVLHKIRFGQPGTPMPAGVASGWSTDDAVDVLGYAQTLPE